MTCVDIRRHLWTQVICEGTWLTSLIILMVRAEMSTTSFSIRILSPEMIDKERINIKRVVLNIVWIAFIFASYCDCEVLNKMCNVKVQLQSTHIISFSGMKLFETLNRKGITALEDDLLKLQFLFRKNWGRSYCKSSFSKYRQLAFFQK